MCGLSGIFSLSLAVSLCFAQRWDREGARSALEEARLLREQLSKVKEPSKDKYLSLIHTYKEVFRKDPHYSGSDDAICEAGEVYQEMGQKFGAMIYYRDAAKMYEFLLKDYGGSPRCADALLHLGELYSGPLDDEGAAQKAYDELRSKHKKSKAAQILKEREASKAAALKEAPKEVSAQESQPEPAPSENGSAHGATVQNIRHWTTSDYTRIIIDLDIQTRYTKTRLSSPDRIFFDIANAKLSKELLNKTFVVSDEFLKQVRVAQNRLDVVRVVLDFSAISDYSVFELYDPFRIVVDIHGVRTEKAKAESTTAAVVRATEPKEKAIQTANPSSGEGKRAQPGESKRSTNTAAKVADTPASTTQPKARDEKADLKVENLGTPASKPAASPEKSDAPQAPPQLAKAAKAKTEPPARPTSEKSLPLPKAADKTSLGSRTMTRVLGLKIGRIVIDPGHGGHDTGTIGRGGLMEKDLVLQVARDLKRLIEDKIGAEVVLTRNDDSFVSLEERTAIANQARADLFLSIHANSSTSRVTSGVETYYLDFAHNDAEREVAARENASTVRNVRDLQNLVRKIAQADKSAESRELAAILQRKLFGGARQLFPAARNRGVRSAPFVVLIGANMPSVLAEVAFISNPRDEKVLRQESNRAQLARALFAGIEGYMKTLGSEMARNRPGDD